MRVTTSLAFCAALNAFSPVLALPPPVDGLSTAGSQKPLGGSTIKSSQGQKHRYTVKEHAENADICIAGTKQYTGTVSVSDEKDLFYWFFESRNDPKNSPVVIWINGGPGGSSMFGLFTEVGPCQTNEPGNETSFEKHSWVEFSNVLFIDQPAGVGFSTIRNGFEGGPDNLAEAAQDFTEFLITFFRDIFPQYAHNDFHIAGESFAGKYVPGFTYHINHQHGSDTSAIPPIQSIILVNAVIDSMAFSMAGHYDHFCSIDKDGKPLKKNGFNETACRALEEDIPECERLGTLCRESYDPVVCETAYTHCDTTVGKWLNGDIYLGGRMMYDDRKICEENPPLCLPFNGTGFAGFLNQSHVKEELGFSKDFVYVGINMELNDRWQKSREMFLPTTREISWVLDKTDTKVLVLNGNNDIGVNTESQKRIYDHLPWRRQAAFRMHQYKDWQWPDEAGKLTKGGEIKATDDIETANKLAFASIDEAGHPSPGDQKEAVTWLVKCWTDGAKQDKLCPF